MSDITAEEMFESLDGFEEIAIAKHFDAEIGDLAQRKPTMFARALVFTALVRDGTPPAEAKHAAMAMPLKAVNDHFAEDNEVTPEEPETEPGKGFEPHEQQPTNSPPSA